MSFFFLFSSCQKNENSTSQLTKNPLVTPRESSSNSCLPELASLSCPNPIIFTEVKNGISIPMYPGCTFDISYDFSKCILIGAGIYEFHIGEIKIINAYNCPQYEADLLAASANEGTLFAFLKNVNSAFTLYIENAIISDLTNQYGLFFMICGNGNNVNISFYESLCARYCIYRVDGKLKWDRLRCGIGCCQRRTKICVMEETNEIIKTTTFKAIGGSTNCTGPNEEPTNNCTVKLTSCRYNCG